MIGEMPHWHTPRRLIRPPFSFIFAFPTLAAVAVATLVETMVEVAAVESPGVALALPEADIRKSYLLDLEQFQPSPCRD